MRHIGAYEIKLQQNLHLKQLHMTNMTFSLLRPALLGLVLSASFSLASAAVVVVTPGTTWGTIPGENSGGGSSAITATAPHDGNGSVEMFGDRTRYSMGNYYSTASNLGLVSQVTQLTYQYQVALNSVALLNADYTPALRLHIFDGLQRSELIWEGAYNGVYGSLQEGIWYSSAINDQFYQFKTGQGVTLQNGSQVNQTIAQWLSSYSSAAYVSAISIGVGGSAGTGYHAFADDVTFGINGVTTTYNFETAAVAAVPEPGSLALLGLGLAGLAAFRKRKQA